MASGRQGGLGGTLIVEGTVYADMNV